MHFLVKLATLNPALVYVLIITCFLGICLTLLFATRRFINNETRRAHNDIAGFIFTTVGAIYGVLLAFITVIVWGQYNQAADNAAREATASLAMYRNLSLYPDREQAGKASQSLLAFIHAAAEDEYPAMARMKKSRVTAQAMDTLWANTKNLKPQNFQEQVLFSKILQDLNNIAELRAERLGSVSLEPKLSGIMRGALIFGAIITLVLAVFFGAEKFWWHIILTSMLAILVGTILFVMLELAHPFTSGIAIKPDAYITVLEIIKAK